MEITEVRIKLVHESPDRLLAFCSITFDNQFVVRDLKIIQGSRGPFVAMPSRKLMDRCRRCGGKNALRSSYCNQCGTRLAEDRAIKESDGRAKLYADIAHPINSECRERIQSCVLAAFEEEKILAGQPGYVCRYDDYGEHDSSLPPEFDAVDFELGGSGQRPASQRELETPPPELSISEPPRSEAVKPLPVQPPHAVPSRRELPERTAAWREGASFAEGVD